MSQVVIRHCRALEEFQACVALQREIWEEEPLEVEPATMFVVAAHTGGQVLGAFDGDTLVGFTLAVAGIEGNQPYLHSHMTGIKDGYRDQAIGRRLKFFQREDALRRGIEMIRWTFDPLEVRNAHFNLNRLGATCRKYLPNLYGVTTSPLHRGLRTDRLLAEWRLKDSRVAAAAAGAAPEEKVETVGESTELVRIDVPQTLPYGLSGDISGVTALQDRLRDEFTAWFAKGYEASAVDTGRRAGVCTDAAKIGSFDRMRINELKLREVHMQLVTPFETSMNVTYARRILLVELKLDGVTGWAECVAGEDPFYSPETTDTAWHILRDYVWPMIKGKEFASAEDVWGLLEHVRGHSMAKGVLEAAVWEAEARMKSVPLAKLIGGVHKHIACGVSIGIKATVEELLEAVKKEIAAGYQRIKIKIKPGKDVDQVKAIRQAFPGIKLMVDANSAYRLEDWRRLKELESFYLMMIEQPLGWDDLYSHIELQRRLDTPICLDECIHTEEQAKAAIDFDACKIMNIKLGRVGGYTVAKRIHDLAQQAGMPVWCGGMLESGIGRAHNIALSTLPNFSLPGDVTASKRYWAEDIIEPEVTVSRQGVITVPTGPGMGFEPRVDLIDKLSVRTELLQ